VTNAANFPYDQIAAVGRATHAERNIGLALRQAEFCPCAGNFEDYARAGCAQCAEVPAQKA
jgi:hypothetical protein